MSEGNSNGPAAALGAANTLIGHAPGAASAALPAVATRLSAAEVRDRLSIASRRGRLPGYSTATRNGDLFSVCAFGHPFDGVMLAEAREADAATRLRFRWRLAPRGPAVFAAILVLTVWPGLYFMDQAMIQFLPGIREAISTGTWYVPLSVVSGAWAWISVLRRTRRAVGESARQLVRRIAEEIDGTVDAAQPAPK